MLQTNFYGPERTFERQKPGPGAFWPVPPVLFPGLRGAPLEEMYCRPAGIELTTEEAARLAKAVIVRALRDARSPLKSRACGARRWLENDAAVWLDLLGTRIDQADINEFLKRCPATPQRKI